MGLSAPSDLIAIISPTFIHSIVIRCVGSNNQHSSPISLYSLSRGAYQPNMAMEMATAKVMESDKSNSLIRKSSENQLMPPPPKRIKRPKKVIDEDSYTDAISEIIARDFFPGLLESEVQQEYLDAQDSGDRAWISSASRRLSHVMTPGRKRGRTGTTIQTPMRASAVDTPRGSFAGDTPMTVASDISTSAQAVTAIKVDTNMSLDKFQSIYTSEDNESFYKLIDKQNQKRAEKYEWMWTGNNKKPSKMMLKQKEIELKLLQSGVSLVDDGTKRDRLAINDVDERPAKPDSWRHRPDNLLMFAPDSVEDSIETVAQKIQNESRAAPKSVVYANTRMPPPEVIKSAPLSPTLSAVQDAIAGHRRPSELNSSEFGGSETPRVNGYAFVDDEPEAEEAELPIPTIDLGKGNLTKNPFVMKQQSAREDLHHRMVEKNVRSKRMSTRVGMTGKVAATPAPRFPSSPRVGAGQLTPAAQRLWSKVGSSASRSTPNAFGGVRTPGAVKTKSGLSARWTPVGKNSQKD